MEFGSKGDILRGRVAIVLPNLNSGGVERVRLLLAKEFKELGYEVDFVLRQAKGELLDEVPAGMRIVDLNARRVRQFPMKFANYLREVRPNIVLAALWPLSALSSITARLVLPDAKVIVSEHNVLSVNYSIGFTERWLLRLTGRMSHSLADAVIVVSEDIKRDLSQLTGLSESDIVVIGNPCRIPVLESVRSPDDILKLVGIGSLKAVKGFDLLIEAVSILAQTRPVQLTIVGEGSERARLEWLISEKELCGIVDLPGYDKNVFKYLSRADFFVLSSHSEGFPNVVTEALACGTPVVATRCSSGPAEILDNGRYGVLVETGKPDCLADGVIAATQRSWDRTALHERALFFDAQSIARKYLDSAGETIEAVPDQ